MRKNLRVEEYLKKKNNFKKELYRMREIISDFNLDEEFKWWTPVYDYNGKNVIILGAFKNECIMTFVKGGFIQDPYNILDYTGPNAQSGRVLRFKNIDEINKLESVIKDFIAQAIEIEISGKKNVYAEYPEPDELKDYLRIHQNVNEAWKKLTPGRRKSIVLYISTAKKTETRINRIEKCVELILAGKGMNDD